MSVVYYATGEGEILVSTMAERVKAKAVAFDPKVSLCVRDEQPPPTYVQVYRDAVIETDLDFVVDVIMKIAGVMAGQPMPEDVRPMVEEGVRKEQRVALMLRRYATLHQPPRHEINEADMNENLIHTTSTSMPW